MPTWVTLPVDSALCSVSEPDSPASSGNTLPTSNKQLEGQILTPKKWVTLGKALSC